MTTTRRDLTRRHGRRRSVAALVVAGLAAAALLTGQAAGGSAQAASSDTTTLTVNADTQMTTFNPFLSYYDGELNVIGTIYPSLTMLNDQGEPVPYLADSWTTSPDKLTWTFKIHPGLKWSDGQPLTAADAAWTFNLIMHNATAATSNGSLVANFKSVTAPDATTLVIKTKQPQANMLYLSVPISGIPIVPEHVWKSHVSGLKNYRNMDFPVVGYGPFVLTGFKTNQYAEMTANKSFFLGAPHFDKVVTNYYSNSDAAAAALTSGELDQIDGLTPAQYNAISKKSGIQTYQTQSNGWSAIEINSGAKTRSGKPLGTGNPILKDIRVRQAIALGINRQELVTKVLDGNGVVGAGYLPPGYPQFFWKPSASESLDYNPARAKQMLDAAGYKMGPNGVRVAPDGKPLEFRLGIHSDDATDAAIAPYVKEWMSAIGIKLDVNSMSFDQLNNNLAKGDWDMLMDGWSTGPDPTYLLSIQTCGTLPDDNGQNGNTDAFFCNKSYDRLYSQQQTQFNAGQRAATIAKMQKILYAGNGDLILFYKNGLDALRTDSVTDYLQGAKAANGFYPLQHGFTSWWKAEPPAGAATAGQKASQQSSNAFKWIGLAVLVVVLIGVAVMFLRRRTAAERE
ncbi:MAG TPA: ABC transporter substrate-binding protein [Nocardioides sp.]|uniref:ABC transporter substrate-binding protein n=1 Tax=Nocardioides sp. TaxID=35761 RepID=UPI002E324905|nr:ABC transporter substrate-binding protein [Nocardioides sp.]HEX3929356.1 ABC transporter substrate-binding protein [Nocardioides sp.]